MYVPCDEPASSSSAPSPLPARDPRVHARHRRIAQHTRRSRRATERHVGHQRHARGVRQHELERRRGAPDRRAARPAPARATLELAPAGRAQHARYPPGARGRKTGLSPLALRLRRSCGSSTGTVTSVPTASWQVSSACTTMTAAVVGPPGDLARAHGRGLRVVEVDVARAWSRYSSYGRSSAVWAIDRERLAVGRERGRRAPRRLGVRRSRRRAPVARVGRERPVAASSARRRTRPRRCSTAAARRSSCRPAPSGSRRRSSTRARSMQSGVTPSRVIRPKHRSRSPVRVHAREREHVVVRRRRPREVGELLVAAGELSGRRVELGDVRRARAGRRARRRRACRRG